MNNLKVPIILLVLLRFSIGAKGQDLLQKPTETSRADVALSFINCYVKYCNTRNSWQGTVEWIEANKLLTKKFKTRYRELVEEAIMREPGLGLGFDPILDAQDYPDKGFELVTVDNGEYVTVRGKDWATFTTVIRVRLVEDKWMVDGAGIINIPKEKQKTR